MFVSVVYIAVSVGVFMFTRVYASVYIDLCIDVYVKGKSVSVCVFICFDKTYY